MLFILIDVHELFSHLGGSGLSVRFNKFAKNVVKTLGVSNDQAKIDSIYNQIKTWSTNTYL